MPDPRGTESPGSVTPRVEKAGIVGATGETTG
ncbi:hypothetical protein PSET11_02097 [Arthrobacter ulcerisalmonis]|uniref:Uncharacterized protein n=1 Tax=Arthrobacter ulcerisalmonis TaxID=2483813 RepID=A0A3P5WZ22_9MICC|nr:hypothetical protein PSET11_02097 [Arthrobacter ulcerisalmonis]